MTDARTITIYQPYGYPDLLRQTPGGLGTWNEVRFLINDFSEPCDVLVVLNRVMTGVTVACREAWLIVQEPPVQSFPWVFEGHKPFSLVCSPFYIEGYRYRHVHGALPWHIGKTYDQLKALNPSCKDRLLSWVTSDKAHFPGHINRMAFLNKLKSDNLEFDLYGRGFLPVVDKYEGLGPYRYSLAIENYSGPHYWTEKIADCFLSWTMPIYYGCVNISDYFPKESFIQIDIHDTCVSDHISDVINSDRYLQNRDAVAEARRLVLEEYQLFPFLMNLYRQRNSEKRNMPEIQPRRFYPYHVSFKSRVMRQLRKMRKQYAS
jgi:hypothetical protein